MWVNMLSSPSSAIPPPLSQSALEWLGAKTLGIRAQRSGAWVVIDSEHESE